MQLFQEWLFRANLIKSSAEISVTDLKDVANDIFKVYVYDGKFMLNEMNDQCYIYI